MNERLKNTYRSFRLRTLHYTTAFLLLYIYSPIDSFAQTTVNSLSALRPYLDQDNANVKMASGTYTLSAADVSSGVWGVDGQGTRPAIMLFSGSNSTYDFTGVTIQIDPDLYWVYSAQVYELNIIGNNNSLKNLTLLDLADVDDASNNGVISIVMDGRNNTIDGFNVTAKGSYPYGYGEVFGKGPGAIIPYKKHSGILIRGEYNTLKNTNLQHKAFGHGFVMQGALNPTIEGCYVEGELRTTDDILAEDGTGSAADQVDFMSSWGYTLTPGYMICLAEEGIRAYTNGTTILDGVAVTINTTNPTILNNTIKNMRAGVTLTHARGTKYVEGCTAIGCLRGYAIGSGDIVDCSADTQYGPAFGVDYTSDSDITADITLLSYTGNTYNGSGHAAIIIGSNHDITFKNAVDNADQQVKINIGGDNNTIGLQASDENYSASGITINNLTNYPIVLDDNSSNNTITTCGSVTNNGSGNSISTPSNCSTGSTSNIAQGKTASQSSNFSTSSGLAHEAVDGNTNGNWNNGSVTHTQANTSNPWWEVDLDGTYDVDEIIIFNRTNSCCKSRLSNFTVSVLDGNTTTFSQTFSSYPDPSLTINAGNATGDVIRVQINGTGTLSLAEVEAYGELSSVVGGDFQLVKRNSTGFAIDGGGNNGAEGRSIELYTYLQHNNLTWTEISLGGGFYAYQKRNSNVCFDGGDGGDNGQDVTLEVCDFNDQNQHWLKIDAGNGHYRLEKRGTNFSLDGGGGGAIDQNVYLWTSNSNNQNQQWRFDNVSSSRTINDVVEEELTQNIELKMYPNPVSDQLTVELNNELYLQFSIYNVSGSIVRQGELDYDISQLQIDFSGLDRGVYALVLGGVTTYKTVKVIKE